MKASTVEIKKWMVGQSTLQFNMAIFVPAEKLCYNLSSQFTFIIS